MIAFRYEATAGVMVETIAHEVEADGDDWAARCGKRWSRKADGGVLPAHYTGKVCEACGAVT